MNIVFQSSLSFHSNPATIWGLNKKEVILYSIENPNSEIFCERQFC